MPNEEVRRKEGELKRMLKEEEVYWKQKSRIQWIQEGDKNTKFFHAHIVKRRGWNKILGLENAQGVWCPEPSQVDAIAVSYFQIFSYM